jgi:integrase
MGPASQAALIQWREEHPPAADFVFPGRPGKALAATVYRNNLKRACRHARVDHITPTQLRKNGAERFRSVGGVDAAKEALGHGHASTTQLYLDPAVQAHALAAATVAG